MEPRISIVTLGVADMRRSIRFYRDGLGFSTTANDDAGWAIFRTVGCRFALFPLVELAKDIAEGMNVASGNFAFFDNRSTRILPEHIMASAALPPGFPMVQVGTDYFWDGGTVSNTPPDA